jgi:hypothetical protein
MQQLINWRERGYIHGLSIPDADIVAQVKAGARHQKPSIPDTGHKSSASDAKGGRQRFRVQDRNAKAEAADAEAADAAVSGAGTAKWPHALGRDQSWG